MGCDSGIIKLKDNYKIASSLQEFQCIACKLQLWDIARFETSQYRWDVHRIQCGLFCGLQTLLYL